MLQNPDQTETPTSDESSQLRLGVASFLASLAFWLALTAAAVGYAIVALGPGYLRWQTALQEQQQNAAELQQLASEIRQLDGLVAAMQQDPGLAAALSAARNGTDNPELARLTAVLQTSQTTAPQLSPDPPATDQTHWKILLRQASEKGPLRSRLMWGSAALTLLAFTFMNDAGGAILAGLFGSVIRLFSGVFRRYVPATTAAAAEAQASADEPLLTLDSEPDTNAE